MISFEKQRNIAVQMVSVLWRLACEYAHDELYEEVKTLMEKVIMSVDDEELIEAMKAFPLIRVQLELIVENAFVQVEQSWKMQGRDKS